VTLVGYTNAGKSSLLNRLTESSVAAGSRMFETLDPTSRRLRVPVEREVLLADTVGFIRDLPPELLEAFRATLEEIETSSLILHVVDASEPDYPERMTAVVEILEGLALGDIPRLVVYNKVDLLTPEVLRELGLEAGCVLVSASTGEGAEALVARIGAMLKERGKLYETASFAGR
jgi:GTP-binding protein HflX